MEARSIPSYILYRIEGYLEERTSQCKKKQVYHFPKVNYDSVMVRVQQMGQFEMDMRLMVVGMEDQQESGIVEEDSDTQENHIVEGH